jgi:hypothetical protein
MAFAALQKNANRKLKLMTSLFKKPKPPPVVAMPDPDDMRIKNAYKKEFSSARMKSGRASTQLSGDDSYSGTTTGSA